MSPPATPHRPLRIAILGAGIGGLALALALTKHHISYTLYEAAPEFSALGAGIAFGPNALRAMAMLDARLKAGYDGVATGNASAGKEHVFHEILLCEEGLGRARGWEPAGVEYACYAKSSCHRRELLEVMRRLVPAERVVFGKRAVRVTQGVEGVEVGFADGSVVVADALVGCDGGKGVTRRAVLVDGVVEEHPVLLRRRLEDVDASYAGRYVYRAIVPMEDAREILGEYAGDGKMFVGEGKYFATYQMSGGAHLNLLAGRQDDKPWTHDQWTKEVTKEEMLRDFEGCDSRLVKLLDVSEISPPQEMFRIHHAALESKKKGK
jgi:salicylate hydroxylase